MVCQTGVFFWDILHLDVNDHTTISQTGFFKTRSVRPWYGHWHLGTKMCLKKNEKNPVCETAVWSLADRVENLIKKWLGLSDSDMVTGGLSWNLKNLRKKFL